MNATGTAVRPRPAPAVVAELRSWTAGLVLRLRERISRMSTFQQVLGISISAALLLPAAAITLGPHLVGYLGVFGLSVLTNALLFIPSGRWGVMVAGILVLNPFAVAVLCGVGGALGELTGYALGRSSRKLLRNHQGPSWLRHVAENRTPLMILALNIVPNPFVDVIGIIAGRAGYPVHLFLTYSIIGRVIQCIVIVYVALWNISLISAWFG